MTDAPATPLPSAVLLYASGKPAPRNAAEAFGPISEQLAGALADLPNGEQRVFTLNGVAFEIGFWDVAMENRRLLADLSVSPLRSTLEPVVHEGQAFASLAAVDGDPRTALMLVSSFAGTLFEETGAEAIWLPEQSLVNTQVMFMHDLYEDQMERTWFRVHAMRAGADSPDAVAFTRGLRVIGSHELQIRVPGEPAGLFAQLTDAVEGVVKDGTPVVEGMQLAVNGTTYSAVPGEDVVGEGTPVLELVEAPAASGPAAAEKPRKKGWFGRR